MHPQTQETGMESGMFERERESQEKKISGLDGKKTWSQK